MATACIKILIYYLIIIIIIINTLTVAHTCMHHTFIAFWILLYNSTAICQNNCKQTVVYTITIME